MKLVSDWRKAWKWISVQCMTLALVVQPVWLTLPDDLRASAPSWIMHGVTALLLIGGIIGRLIDQPSAKDAP